MEQYAKTEVSAFTVDSDYISSDSFDGLPLVPFDKCASLYPSSQYTVLISAGYKKMNSVRADKYKEIKLLGYDIQGFIHPTAFISDNCCLGEGNIVLENSVVSYGVTVGNCNIIWNGCNISHESRLGNFNYLSPGVTLGGSTVITNNCFLGMNAVVLGGTEIREKTLIGANAFVKKDTNPLDVYVPSKTMILENHKSTDIF